MLSAFWEKTALPDKKRKTVRKKRILQAKTKK
jgi:hypothetical protein